MGNVDIKFMNLKNFVIATVVVSGLIIVGAFIYANISSRKIDKPAAEVVAKPTPQPLGRETPKPSTASAIIQPSGKAEIRVTAAGFEPKTITVKKGNIVVWLNESGQEVVINSAVHPTHKEYPPLNLGKFPDASSMSIVFYSSGKYSYHNHLNPSQTGTVIVE